jgi:glucose-1-phosphate adenylyltransferase
MEPENVLAIILGGGRGTRLFPLTQVRAKPAVPIAGKYRLIDIPISNCINSQIQKIFVLTQFNSESLNRHINRTYRFSIFSHGFVGVIAAEQTMANMDWFQGTADAVRQSLRHFREHKVDYLLILSGDQLYRMDYREMLRSHIETKADITISAIPVGGKEASSFGILKMDRHRRIVQFREKPRPEQLSPLKSTLGRLGAGDRPYLASMGIYLFNREVLIEVLKDETKVDFGKEVIPAAIPKHRVCAFLFDGYWEDIGTIKAFYKANIDLTHTHPPFRLYDPSFPLYTHPRFLPDSKIIDCTVHHALISDGAVITKANVSQSIIGIRSQVGQGTRISRSLIMGADFFELDEDLRKNKRSRIPNVGIGDHCTITQAIIDKNARIGKNVSITNAKKVRNLDGPNYFIRDGIVIIPKNAIVPDGTVI